jgi:hypothetical protein
MSVVQPSGSDATLRIGRVLSRTFYLVRCNFFAFIIFATVAEIPGTAYTWRTFGSFDFGRQTPERPGGMSPLAYIGIIFIGSLIGFIFQGVLQGPVAYGSFSELKGRHASFGDCVAMGRKTLLPVFAVATLATLGTFIGYALLLIPGVILSLGWLLVVPVLVIERTPIFDVFGRSWRLTNGSRGVLFALFVVVGVASLALEWALTSLATLVVSSSGMATTVYLVASAIADIATSMFSATLVGVIYYELRSIKEGIGPETVATVFD